MSRNRSALSPWSPRRLAMALEPRLLFDGAAPAAVVAVAQDDGGAAHHDAPAAAPVDSAPRELIVVDSRVGQGIDLAQALDGKAQVLVLDQQSDGLEQIATALDGQQNVLAIHVLSHGGRDGLVLGRGLVGDSELRRQSPVLARIGAALSADADILLYGCDVAAASGDFMNTLATLTQADVAASTDATGSAAWGGNWLLEAASGPIEASALVLSGFDHLLAPPGIVDSGGTRSTSEDSSLVVTGVSVADLDGDDQSVTLSASNGTVTLAAGSGVIIDAGADGSAAITFSGTLAQVNAAINGMVFAPTADYFGAANIALSTFDGSTSVGPTNIVLTVTAVDDLPVATADAIAASEDAAAVTGDVLANDINLDSPVDTLAVIALRTGTVAAGSGSAGSIGNPLVGAYGSLTVAANGSYTYTLDNGLAAVQALHGGQTITENFAYTITDGQTQVQADITVTVTGTNDAPMLIGTPLTRVASSIPENATDAENPGAPVGALLTDVDGNPVASDVDAGTDLGVAVFGSSTTNGMTGAWQYSLDGGATWTPAAAFSPTAALLLPAAARLRFVADDNADDSKESGVATIAYYAWDGSDGASAGDTADVRTPGGSAPFSADSLTADFIVTARNDVPTLTPVALVLNEGATASLTDAELPVTDQDNQDDQLTYRVDVLPLEGVLFKNGIPVSVGSLFTQEDVVAGKISYRHTGGELLVDTVDSVGLSLRDGAGGVIDLLVLPIAIRDVNAAIAITGASQTVAERIGDEASDFTVLDLGLSDADGDPALMTLTVATLPDPLVGRLQYWDGSAYVDVGAGLVLTQAQLLARPLHFISSGAEPALVAGSGFSGTPQPVASFDVVASDNKASGPSSDARSVTLTIAARNDAPTPVTNLLTVDQGASAAITSALPAILSSSDPDSDAAKRVYTLNGFPVAGLLRLSGVIIGTGATFSQADLDAGRLTYTHGGGATDNDPLIADDSFDFSVNDRDGAIATGTLEINVDPVTPTVPGPGGTLWGITAEGLFTAINSTTLTGSASYTLTGLPAYGALYLNAVALDTGDTFSEGQLAAGEVVYVNLGSEPASYALPFHDGFEVSRSGGAIASGSALIDLIVTPVDDAPIIAQTQDTVAVNQDGGTLMEESAVSGSNDFALAGVSNAVKLTLANLQHVDPDTDPTALAYVLENAPTGGELRRWDGSTWLALAAGATFTAPELAGGELAYFHDADSELLSDSIVVNLRDGGVVQVGDVLIGGGTISEQGFVTVNDGSTALTINKGVVARSPSRTVTFTVANVNDAPLAGDGNFAVDEGYNTGSGGADNNPGRIRVLDASIMPASDSDNSLNTATYGIVSLPALGTLEIDTGGVFVALVAGDLGTSTAQFTHAMLIGGKLRYVQDGSDLFTTDSFTWRLNDNSAVAPFARDSNVATVSIDIRPQNDPPVIFNNTGASVPEGGLRNITELMLGSPRTDDTDVDNTRRQTQFRVTAGVQSGTLYLEKASVITALGAGSSFTLGDIQDGYLKYRHNGSEMPSLDPFDRFAFVISDGSGGNEPTGTFEIEIQPVNDAPQLSGLNPLTYFEDDGPTLIDSSLLFNDVDLANGANYYAGTTLTIAYTGGTAAVGDQLSVRNQGTASGQISVAGSTLSYNFGAGPVVIGAIDGTSSGFGGADLLITFNASANVVAVKALLENLSFHNTDTANASQVVAQATRSLRYTFVDGGGTAGYPADDAGVTLQGADTATATNTIFVKQRNDAPVMIAGNTVLAPIDEDQTADGRSIEVSTLLGVSVSDVDHAAAQGIAVGSVDAGNGSWQFSLDSTNGVDGSWSSVGSVSATSSLLLAPSSWLRFIPDGKNATAAEFTYRAWDQTSGSTGGRANSSLSGETTAFSTVANVVSLTVTAVNDAPLLADTPLAMTQTEDAGAAIGAAGTLISSLVGGISDVDTGASTGGALWLGPDAGNGTWRYSIDNGSNWSDLDAPDAGNARLLATDARIYFVPNANYNGVQAAALTVRAWDRSSGANGAGSVDTTTNGGIAAFSTATDSVSLTVTALNDAPTIVNSTPTISAGFATENTRIALGAIFTLGDIDLARFEGNNTGQISLVVAHGAFVLDTTGVTVTAGSQATDRGAGDWGGGSSTLTFAGTLAQLQTALNSVDYVPGDNPDTSETITVTFNDLNNAGAGAASGGSDIHAVSATVLVDEIDPVNDAPTINRPATVSATEDVQFSFAGGNTISMADVDARNGTVEVALSIPRGSITLTPGAATVTGGALGSGAVTLQGTVSAINAALSTLKYTSAPDDNSLNTSVANRSLAIAVSDLGNGIGGAITTAEAASASTLVNLAAVNDLPTLDVDPLSLGVQSSRLATTVQQNVTTAIDGIVLADDQDINDSGYGSTTRLVIAALHGTLALDASAGVSAVPSGSPSGRVLTLTGTISAINAAVTAGNFKYTADSDFSGNDSLSLVFHDAGSSGSGGDKTAAATIPLLVEGVNDAPAFSSLAGSVAFTEDGPAVRLAGNATVSDPELASYNNWGGAVLTVQRTATIGYPGNAAVDDSFGLTGSGNVGANFNGSNVRLGATVVGSFTNTSGVLTITFDDATTTAQVNTVLQEVTYHNGNDNPPSQVTIGYTINDGNTNTGPTAQGTGSPLALEGNGSVDVTITANNDAPKLTAGSSTVSFFEDDVAFVSALPPATITDPELSFFASGDGDWGGAILSVNRNGGANTEDLFGVTGSGDVGVNFAGSALRIGTLVVGSFTNAGGAFTVTFDAGTNSAQVQQVADALTYNNSRQSLGNSQDENISLAWTINDGNAAVAGTQGEGGAKQNTLITNGITLRGRNDAPVLADTVLAISVPEDHPAPLGGVVGTAVSDLIGGASDIDMNPLTGVAITGSDSTLGTWLYTVDGGTSWSAIGSVTDSGALLLRDSDRVYFQPNADRNGTVAAGLTLRAWDRTSGTTAGTRVNTISNGDTTPFSTATDSVALTVGAQNDAPTRLLASVDLVSSLEDAASPSQATIASLFDGAGGNTVFSDAKDDQTAFTGGSAANGFAGVVITDNAATVAEGKWQYSANGSSGWSDIPTTLTPANGMFLPGAYTLRFLAQSDWNGTPGSLTVRLADDSAGSLPAVGASVNVGNDTTLSGGGTRYSNSANAVTLGTSITSVNDAPAGTDKTISAIEDTAYRFQAGDFGFTDLNDSPANNLHSVLITTLPATGTLELAGSAVTVLQSISVADIANLTWTPPADLNGSAVASFTFQVVDDGGVLDGGIDTDPSANTITFNVSAVVDIADDTAITDEDTAVTTSVLANDSFAGNPLV
ncbi:MAG: DUF4347 domain-containing protein, partial [Rhodobacteraceae bacterium]|nr:DUF4347 domain-containing protein [Paracoccaceae bacterium]